jgi:hypothetical protein
MNHKQFEIWILDGVKLTLKRQKELNGHIAVCEECRSLQAGWTVSKNLLKNAAEKTPAPGFTSRWQETLVKKQRVEKIRGYRITLFGLLLLAFITSLVFLVASGSFEQMLASTFNSITQLLIGITNGLSSIGYWLRQLPVFVPLTAGFILFGLFNTFLLAIGFMLWNVKNRKKLAYETASK